MPGSRARSRLMRGRGRGKRSFKKSMIRRIDTSKQTAKSLLVYDQLPITLATKSLWDQPITGIVQGDTRDQRERNTVWLTGIRLRITFRNGLNIPLYVHCALVNPRDAFPDDGTQLNTWSNINFFSALGANNRIGYASSHATNPLTGLQWGTLPINTDTLNVIWHMRFKLGIKFNTADQGWTTGAGAPNYRTLSRYIKIGKKIAYKSSAGNTCLQPMYFIVWCSSFEEPAASQQTASLVFQPHIVTYFRDPKR